MMCNKRILMLLVLFFLQGCTNKNDSVAIVVNGKKILHSQIEEAAEIIHSNMVKSFPQKALEGFDSELLKGAARQLIANEVLYNEAQKRNIGFNPDMIDSTLIKIKQQFGDKESYKKELTSMGETEESMRKHLEKGALIDSLMKVLSDEAASVSDQECLEFYRKDSLKFMSRPEVRVSQIFFPVDTGLGKNHMDSVQQLASKVFEEAKKGEKFIALAKKYSRGPGAEAGGDMGWFKHGDLSPELDKAVSALKTGEISTLLSTDAGYHIFMKTDEKQGAVIPFDNIKQQISSMLQMKKKNDYVVSIIDSLILLSDIKYLDEKYKN